MSQIDPDRLRRNVASKSTWMRFLHMLFIAILLWVASLATMVVIVLQFLMALFTGAPNQGLRDLGGTLGEWIHKAVDFMVYGSDGRPWPIEDWEDYEDGPEDDDDDPEPPSETDDDDVDETDQAGA